MTRIEELLELSKSDKQTTIVEFMKKYKCSPHTAKKVYLAKGWGRLPKEESAKQKGGRKYNHSDDKIIAFINKTNDPSIRNITMKFKITYKRARLLFDKAGVECKKPASKLNPWPQDNDSMNGKSSLMGLRVKW